MADRNQHQFPKISQSKPQQVTQPQSILPPSRSSRYLRGLRWGWLIGIGLGLGVHLPTPGLAIDRTTIELLTFPLQTVPETACESRADLTVVTQSSICQQGNPETDLTDPSLWWTQAQFGGNLLQAWFAFPGADGSPRRVDLLVNGEAWDNSGYLDLYRFIHQFGTAARDFDYNVRVFNPNGALVGAYICQEITVSSGLAQLETVQLGIAQIEKPDCQIFLNPYGRNALRGTSNLFSPP